MNSAYVLWSRKIVQLSPAWITEPIITRYNQMADILSLNILEYIVKQ